MATAVLGSLAPTTELEGTVYYKEVSHVATEVNGKVNDVLFEEGQHLDARAPMVRLDYALLAMQLAAARAQHEQAQTQLAQERVRLERAVALLEDEVLTPQEYDDIRFTVEALEHRVAAVLADVNRFELEIERKTIRAPFPGTVISRLTEVGEWKQGGEAIAIFARDDLHDVIVNVPERYLDSISTGAVFEVRVGDRILSGTMAAVIPRGDIPTRSFPVRIRIENEPALLEGMSAFVNLPTGPETQVVLVPRDALVLEANTFSVVTVNDGVAARVAVTVVGYDGRMAGIESGGLEPGTQVITKGHERLRDGTQVEIMQ